VSDYGRRLLGGTAAGAASVVVWLVAGYLGDGMFTPGDAVQA
jgi:hypothetical protein